MRLRCLVLTFVMLAAATAQAPLAEAAKIAHQRAERAQQRPKLLEPFLADLSADFETNKVTLQPRLAAIVELGPDVVPELLERLHPAQQNDANRNLAANCRLALQNFDLSDHFGCLVELVTSGNETARNEAIRLLGRVPVPAAAPLLTEWLDHTQGEQRRLVLNALGEQRSQVAAPKVATMLASADRNLRGDALACLTAIGSDVVVETVRAALLVEKENKLLPSYIEFFAATTRENAAVTRDLLPLLARDRTNWRDTKRLVEVLATIAPRDHEPTVRNLTEIITSGETNHLGLQAALTLQALGDRNGLPRLRRAVDEQLRKPGRRTEAALYELRGQIGLATEDYTEALADFERALTNAGDTASMARLAHVGMMRCEARKKRIVNLTKLMKSSGMTVAEIEAIGETDPVFHETLQQEKVRAFLAKLATETK